MPELFDWQRTDPCAVRKMVEPVRAGGAEQIQGDRTTESDGPTPAQPPTTVVNREEGSSGPIQPGAIPVDAQQQPAGRFIVFVCTGNTCRSPLAEALCKVRLAERLGCTASELPERGFHVLSAGLAATSGGPAAEEAVEVARAYGADLGGHRSQPLTSELAAQADFLIAMTRGHLLTLTQGYHELAALPRLLSPDGSDLADPIGYPSYVYAECARQIWGYLTPLIEELQPTASKASPNS